MNHILQNVKSGFANMKELVGIFLSVDHDSDDGYSVYINSEDAEISQIAQELKNIEEKQESSRLSLFANKSEKKVSKKKLNSEPSSKNSSSQKIISSKKHIRDDKEPEK